MALSKSWVVRIWLVILLLSFLAAPVAMLVSNGPGSTPASAALTVYLALWLGVWSTVIIVLSAGSVSLEAEIVADSILCRACTRTQYILAKLASRALVIGGVYLIIASAAAYVSWRYGANDVTFGTVATGIGIVGLALLMLVALGVAMSAIFNNTIVSIVGLLLLWHVAGTLFAFAGVEYMSPTSLTGRLPEILRDSRAPQVVSCSATRTSVSVIFSKDLSPDSAEQLDNYTVEDPAGTRHVPQTAVYDSATATVRLSGLSPEVSEPVTVTVDGVTDGAGNEVSPGANQATSGPIPAAGEDETQDELDDEEGAEADDEEGITGGASAALLRPAMAPTVMAALIVAPSLPVAAQGQTDNVDDVVSPTVGEATPRQGGDEPEADPADELPAPSPGVIADPDDEQPAPSPEEIPQPDPSEVRTAAPPAPEPAAETAVSAAAAAVIPRPAPVPSGIPPGALPPNVPPPPVAPAIPAPNPNEGGVAAPPDVGAEGPDSSPEDSTGRPPRVTKVTATRATVSVTFSQDMDPVEVEELANYTVESPPGTPRLPKTGTYDPSEKTVLLSGLSLAPGDPVKVTVEDMTGRGGAKIDPRHNSATFSEVQTWKYLVGFGVPALLFAFVGVVWFSWRDL